jgi:mannose-1-phosphate guanylyltransferase/mannose-6-phosphate isomerase
MSPVGIVPVVICGGAGTRLWPASRESLPKQFIPLLGELSMFQATLQRVRGPAFAPPLIVTHTDFRFLVESQMKALGVEGTIVLEPARRDSGPAIAAAAVMVERTSPGALALVLPSDHLVTDVPAFVAAVERATPAATAGRIVTFGMLPDRPHTGYGYIKPAGEIAPGVKAVDRFVEKPDAPTAARYIAEGHLWNGGIFLFRAADFLAELDRFEPDMVRAASLSAEQAAHDLGFVRLDAEAFAGAPKKSIDYAVMERTDKAAVVPAAFGWSDVGSWSSVWDVSSKDAEGNSARGEVEFLDSRNCLARTEGPLTVVLGLEDVVVLVEDDAVLVARKDRTEDVKRAVEKLKARGHASVTTSRKAYRPWGYYQVLDLGERFQVKRIVVEPGGKLSLQSHLHRAEHWVVVRGTALVTRDGTETMLRENESVFIPLGTVHRLANPGRIPLELIEVQSGAYLGEDDIVRYEDVYNRG